MKDIKGSPAQGLFGATLGFFAGFSAVALFGPTASRFNELLQLDPFLLGMLISIPSLSGSLLRIPFGAWVDATGGRKPFLILLWLSLLGMGGLLGVVTFLYPDNLSAALYPLLLILGVLSGCGIATFSVGVGQVSYWFPRARQGAALGAYAGLGNLAPGIFSFLLPLALSGWGLSGAYLAWFIFLLIGTLGYQFVGRNSFYFQILHQGNSAEVSREMAGNLGQEIFPRGNARQSLLNAMGIHQTWLLVAIYFTTFGGFIALTAWLPTYWKEFFQVSALTAGGLTALYSLTASIVRVFGGTLADRLGGEKTVLLSLGVMLVGSVVMTFSSIYALSITGVLLMALGMGAANASVFKLMPQYIPQAVGGAAGLIGGLGAFGGFVIPPILGTFVSLQGKGGYAFGFITLLGFCAISLILARTLIRSRQVTS